MPETFKLTSHAALAVMTFQKLKRAESRVENLTRELHGYVLGIEDDEQMAEYVRITTEMEAT